MKWEGKESEFFDVLSGCPKGSILGPKFFSIVMDKLLLHLEHSELDCRIGRFFAGSLAYADDIINVVFCESFKANVAFKS